MIKEVCEPCSRPINIGHPILECQTCQKAIHTKCYKLAGFCAANSLWVCKSCSSKITPRYNPFEQMINHDSDKFYDDEGASENETIKQISDILNNCQSYTTKKLNKAIEKLKPSDQEKSPKHPSFTQFSSYFINIDGNTTNFNTLLTELKRVNHKFSVIGIGETNTEQPLQGLYQIPGYKGFYQNTVKNKAKGTGVALYVADNLNAEIIESLGHCNADIESLFVRITPPSGSKTITCGVIYRPPSGNFQNFVDKYDHLCTLLPSSGVRLMGDFNVDLLKINNESNSGIHIQFENSFTKAGLTPVISVPTHKRANCKPSCIDNIFTSDTERVILSGVIEDQIGDHLPIFEITDIQFEDYSKHEKHVKHYEFSNENIRKFVTKLENDITGLTISKRFSEFTEIFGKALDYACKLEKPKFTKRTALNNPWITESIIAAVDRKHELKDDWVNSINKMVPEGDASLRKLFTDYQRVLKAVINSAKHLYDCNRISEQKTDRKKTWKIINELRGKAKKPVKPVIVIDNEKVTDRRKVANEFNKYFNSIASKLNDSIISTDLSYSELQSFEEFLMPSNEGSIFLDDCSESELLEIISQLDNNKSSDIPIRIIKKSAHVICPVLAKYFNLFMAEGTFPDVLKEGKVTPIYKKGSSEDVGNYRPVSTLPIFGKIFEKIIYHRIYTFALSQNIINENQFGFRKSHSTSHAVNYSVKMIEEALKKKHHVLGIFIDLSKAFDTIDHDTLLVKLERYGIRGNAKSLISSYLSGRTQYTEIHGQKSDPLIIKFGVPQGSVLGPLLFLLYINDISNSSNLGTFILFADDTNIFVDGQTAEEAYRKGNELLKSVRKYMVLNKLHINMSKCCYVHFKPKSKTETSTEVDMELLIDSFPIQKSKIAKFLGVVLDDKLSWEPHVAALRRKLNYASATLCRIRDSVPIELHTDLYHTLFESHLTYCISVWGGSSANNIKKVWTAQKHCVRVLFGDKKAYLDKFETCSRARPYPLQVLGQEFFALEHSKPLFKNHNILALENLYTYHTFMEVFKILKLRCPISLYDHFNISSRKETTLITPLPSNDFISRATKIWNSIVPKLKLLDYSYNISLAKSKLKRALLATQHLDNELVWTENDFDINKIMICN